MENQNDIGTVKEYQEITFKALDAMMKAEASKGYSKISIEMVKTGEPMKKYLKEKGFSVTDGLHYTFISW
jgi:hypothetical protein